MHLSSLLEEKRGPSSAQTSLFCSVAFLFSDISPHLETIAPTLIQHFLHLNVKAIWISHWNMKATHSLTSHTAWCGHVYRKALTKFRSVPFAKKNLLDVFQLCCDVTCLPDGTLLTPPFLKISHLLTSVTLWWSFFSKLLSGHSWSLPWTTLPHSSVKWSWLSSVPLHRIELPDLKNFVLNNLLEIWGTPQTKHVPSPTQGVSQGNTYFFSDLPFSINYTTLVLAVQKRIQSHPKPCLSLIPLSKLPIGSLCLLPALKSNPGYISRVSTFVGVEASLH